ncbi:hypothetical protein [Photobacterium atrarenae]|uniref:Uncharacterized protein n=1 Tax=Photobacterium atrarenae TaxID=865757 RepID=A0ABY5GF47_9GAMM|nr:hypothetical protein [Photobacterium atrarenae]UTV27801.1 hypothetical protein NNL38_00270 [Photobacterium atrarenae]
MTTAKGAMGAGDMAAYFDDQDKLGSVVGESSGPAIKTGYIQGYSQWSFGLFGVAC